MTDVLIVFGTRPEAIKMAPIVHALMNDKEVDARVCVTAQHREMLDQVLSLFSIKPDYDFDLMRNGQDLFDVTSDVLLKMRDVLDKEKPKIVLVHGDTTTSATTAMAAFYKNIPVGHVEAGLRTHNIGAPFPEEFNRRLTGLVSNIHFAPTEKSRDNLLQEGVSADDILVTGNSVIDSLFWVLEKINADANFKAQIDNEIDELLAFNWRDENYILLTGHRRENFGEGFLEICNAIADVATFYPNLHFVYPVHLNPNVQQPVNEILADKPNVHLIKPLNYFPFVRLLSNCHIVLTDSGGIQEEGPSIGKPVLVMRDVTERPEAVKAGTVKLVGASRKKIVQFVKLLIEDQAVYSTMSQAMNPYGDGHATARIVERVKEFLGINKR